MLDKLSLAVLAATSLFLAPNAVTQTDKTKNSPDPNEKVCETIRPVGSRLATKRVCATRAEWADYRRQDHDAIDKAQRVGCMTQGSC